MISLLFIRHGATKGNLEKRYIGRTDEPLCDIGISQVLELKNQHFKTDFLYVSPMLRTKQTAELIFPKIPFTVIEDFAEIDFGVFEGKTASELSESAEYQAWVDSMCLDPIPNGENLSEFKSRCCNAFEAIMKKIPDDSTVAFVVHGGIIMAILEAYKEPKQDFYQYHMGNGQYYLLHYKNSCIQD